MADTEKTDTEKLGSEKAASENADAEKPSDEKQETKEVGDKDESAPEAADTAHSQTPASGSTRQAVTEAALEQLAAATGDSSRRARSTRKNADRGVSPSKPARSAPHYTRRDAQVYDSDDSDTDSCVSSVSDSTIDAEIEKAKLPTPALTKEEKKEKKAADDERDRKSVV